MDVLILGHSLVVDTNRKIWDELAMQGHNVDIILPKNWKSNLFSSYDFAKNIETDSHIRKIWPLEVFFNGNASLYFPNPLILRRILKAKKYDFIFVHQESWSISLFFMSLLLRFGKNKKTTLAAFVTQNIYKKKYFLIQLLERFSMKRVDTTFGCNYETKNVLDKKKVSTNWKYLPYSFDPDLFLTNSKKFDKEKIILGYIGRITEEKGIDDILESYYKLKKKYNLHLVIAGGGPLEKKFENLESVEFLGKLKHQEAMNFYKKVDIILLPSKTRSFWKEQFGRVIIEAAASRVPVVGSNSGSIPEVMEKLNLPYVFDENKILQFEEEIENCINDIQSGKIDSIIYESQQKSVEIFSHNSVAKYIVREVNG